MIAIFHDRAHVCVLYHFHYYVHGRVLHTNLAEGLDLVDVALVSFVVDFLAGSSFAVFLEVVLAWLNNQDLMTMRSHV